VFVQTTASTKNAANACSDAAVTRQINEALRDGGAAGGWIESSPSRRVADA
jgi:hypothetical protein